MAFSCHRDITFIAYNPVIYFPIQFILKNIPVFFLINLTINQMVTEYSSSIIFSGIIFAAFLCKMYLAETSHKISQSEGQKNDMDVLSDEISGQGGKNMRIMAILFILLGSNFLLVLNSYALVLNPQVEEYSLSGCLFPFFSNELFGHGNPVGNGMIHTPPFLTKLNHSFGSFDNCNQDSTNARVQPTENNNGSNFTHKVREKLRFRLVSLILRNKKENKTQLICNPALLLDFYLNREFQPVWVTENGLNTKTEVLIDTIRKADLEGLDSRTYHRDDIFNLLAEIEHSSAIKMFEPAKYADLELLLTDALFSYGFNLSEGMVEPYSYNFDWHIKKPKKDLPKIFQAVLNNDRLEELVDILQPRHSGYLRLKSALLKYQNIKKSGFWHKVPAGLKLRKGDAGKRIAALRLRLMATKDLEDPIDGDREYFDEALENGVKRFQGRHGLKVDGIVGFSTLAALNVSLEDRIQQIKLNMERWRWLPQDFGERYILVNTANFQLNVIENERTIKTIRAIVGKKKRPTPILSRKMTYLELNPYWNIPHKIALNDILPRIKKNPNYLTDNSIRIFENWTEDAKELNPESIDWDGTGKDNFIYKLRQDPKSSNALGRVKFMFPNKFAIYLHDTPARELFNKTKRAFSSGCIRVEKPMELAAYLLSDNPKWNLKELITAVNSKKTKAISLPDPINIHILYWTAWVDNDGTTHFRKDIYGRDRKLNVALNKKAASSEVLYGKNSWEKYLSSQNLPKSNPSITHMNRLGSWVVNNASIH